MANSLRLKSWTFLHHLFLTVTNKEGTMHKQMFMDLKNSRAFVEQCDCI